MSLVDKIKEHKEDIAVGFCIAALAYSCYAVPKLIETCYEVQWQGEQIVEYLERNMSDIEKRYKLDKPLNPYGREK